MSEVNHEAGVFTLEQAKALLGYQAPRIIIPTGAAPKTPEAAAKGHSTTTMIFDNPVHLTIDTNDSIYYPQGVHEVPDHLADHWYLDAHGVRRHSKQIVMPAKTIPASAKPPQPRNR